MNHLQCLWVYNVLYHLLWASKYELHYMFGQSHTAVEPVWQSSQSTFSACFLPKTLDYIMKPDCYETHIVIHQLRWSSLTWHVCSWSLQPMWPTVKANYSQWISNDRCVYCYTFLKSIVIMSWDNLFSFVVYINWFYGLFHQKLIVLHFWGQWVLHTCTNMHSGFCCHINGVHNLWESCFLTHCRLAALWSRHHILLKMSRSISLR